jgi:integrase
VLGTDKLQAFRAWLHKRGRDRSADQYSKIVRRWIEDPAKVEAAMLSGDYSPNYRRHLIACVRIYARFTGDGDLLLRLGDIRRPAPVPVEVREPLETDDWFNIRKSIDEASFLSNPTRFVCSLIALRGIRCGDVLRLTKHEIEQGLKTGILAYEGKGERRQQYNAEPLRLYLEGLLACRWPAKGKRVRNLVCPHSSEDNAQETAGREIRKAFDRIADESEMERGDLYAHRFRHTYATLFLQQMTGDPEAIFKLQQQMGWARLDTASNYLRRSRRTELDAIESALLSRKNPNPND